ncbi:splicing factor, CC1-like protein [Sistotremastrum niveocremeum HHB9708]|uniref:Splicing factor, CC1-like protein n=2 Tax=Sistotremastraceae TaxID=3402574 RepID=A0A164XI83_9AGAM|nr:splicing factor, CC1-like protein [Sistotremastrum niveocremeum HHB9708]KZT37389.1 splicing factor, CC1-like protein [Sistotremastrum suecicum HHB10207 ss-3]
MASPSDRLHRRDDRGIPDRPPRSYDGRDDSTSRHRDRGREPEVPREPSLTGREPRSIRAKSPSPLLDDEERLPMSRSAAAEAAARRASPTYEPPSALGDGEPQPVTEDDSEARSVFVSQLAARLTARDLGYFFEDKLGEGAVIDSRIVTDRLSRRSKGIGYVEFRSIDLVPKAIALSGTIVMGLPIMVQLTEAERNRTHAADGIHLPPGVSAPHHGPMQLYVGSLHFNLTESDIKQVFEPFGELEFVDLHRDPMTGRSKGYAFVQYKRPEDAKMALEQMEGFELAGRTLRVNTVHEKGSATRTQQDSLDENGGGNLNAASRQALMQKLARIDTPPSKTPDVVKPNVPQTMTTRCVLLRNMFNPEEETERDWDKDLADDVKKEAESKYGKVTALKVEPQSDGEIYVKFDAVDSATKAVAGLNGRWFGGRQIAAAYISDAIMQAHL